MEEVIPILRVNLQTHKDVHLRLSLFTLLSNLIMKAGDDGEWKRLLFNYFYEIYK